MSRAGRQTRDTSGRSVPVARTLSSDPPHYCCGCDSLFSDLSALTDHDCDDGGTDR